MRKKEIPMRKCILSNEMYPKKNMIRVVVDKKGRIFADIIERKQGRGTYASRDTAMAEKAQRKETLEKYFKVSKEQLDPVYKEIVRLIYREEIPKWTWIKY